MTIEKKLLGTSPSGGGDAPNVADVFSTYLYDGTSSSPHQIQTGIDLDGEGGMVWTKVRNYSYGHILVTTESPGNYLASHNTDFENSMDVTYNSDGHTINTTSGAVNNSSRNYASWTFRKAPRFFDVVTYTGNGTAGREIAHNLGVVPGMIIVKNTNASGESWAVYHRSTGATKYLFLNTTAQANTSSWYWDNTEPTDSVFTIGTNGTVNDNNAEYVAYIFAHDPDGENDDGMIACGSYTGNGNSAFREMNVGWEVQYVLIKDTSVTANWMIFDTTRGMAVTDSQPVLFPNESTAEIDYISVFATANGFGISGESYSPINGSGNTYIYMAIRAPMMVEPEAGTEVFAIDTRGGTVTDFSIAGFPVDMAITGRKDVSDNDIASRITGPYQLETNTTDVEADSGIPWDSMVGIYRGHTSTNWMEYLFKRAKGFFDVVAYTGNAVLGRTVNHSLGVVPEMMWVKGRTEAGNWSVFHKDIGMTDSAGAAGVRMKLSTNGGPSGSDSYWGDTLPTDTVFSVGDGEPNDGDMIAYLFATLDGVSKVGSYTGNGSNQNIACGFSGGARFVLIKRTSTVFGGDWFFWDTERGIVAGNDSHLSLNSTAAQVTSDDSIDPQSAGFTVNQVSATNINVSSGTYIFLAIA